MADGLMIFCGFTAFMVDGSRCCKARHGTPHMALRCAGRGRSRDKELSHVAVLTRAGKWLPVQFLGHAAWIKVGDRMLPANSAAALQLRPRVHPQQTMVKQYKKISDWLRGSHV